MKTLLERYLRTHADDVREQILTELLANRHAIVRSAIGPRQMRRCLRGSELADDIQSAAASGMLRALETYTPGRSAFATWVRHCVRTEILAAYRARRVVPQCAPASGAPVRRIDTRNEPLAPCTDPDAALDVRELLEQTDMRTRWIVSEHHLHHRGFAEIAAELGISASSAAAICARWRQWARSKLEGETL